MKFTCVILLFLSFVAQAQDKIFLKDGTCSKGEIISLGKDFVFLKNPSDNASTIKIPLSKTRMIERYDGRVIVYSDKKTEADSLPQKPLDIKRNSLAIHPLGFLLGRVTCVYERLNKEGTIGVNFPLSLTYDPINVYNGGYQQGGYWNYNPGVNFIGGMDVNFYIGRGKHIKFFVGPRVRYGVDMLLGNIEAYTIQTQFGWRLNNSANKISQHLSVGFGFARILSSQAGNLVNPKQSYGWGSINYRIGVNW